MAKKPIKSPKGTASWSVARVRSATKPGSRRPRVNLTGDRFRQLVAAELAKTNARAVTVHENREHFRAYHRIGNELSRRLPAKPGYGDNVIKDLATAIGRKLRWLHKVRDFARTFDNESLKLLLDHSERLRWQHVVRLLAVEPKELRQDLLTKAAELHWSPADLGRVIQGYFGKRRKGGRPLAKPDPKNLSSAKTAAYLTELGVILPPAG